MKSIFSVMGLLAALALSFTNCQPAEIEPDAPADGQTFRISVFSPGSRTANSGMSTVWSADDALNIFASSGSAAYTNLGQATIVEGAGDSRADFAFTATFNPAASADWYVLYPYNSSNTTPAKLNLKIGAETVSQSAYGSTAHLAGNLCPLYGTVTGKTVSEATIPVHQMSSVIEFNVNNGSGVPVKVKAVKLNATEEVVGSFTADLTGGEPVLAAVSANKSATVSVSSPASLADGSTAKVYMPVKPYTHKSANKFSVTVTLDVDGNTVEQPFNLTVTSAKAKFSAGHIKPVALNLTSSMFYGSMKITSMSAKCHKASVTGEAAAVGTSVIEYRKSGAGSWQAASSTVSGRTVSAELTGLDDDTTYEVRVTAGSVSGPQSSFTTLKEGAQVYNMSFDDWYTSGGVQYCYSSGASSAEKAIWASANKDTYNLTKVNGAAGDESFVAVSGSGKKALKLTSQYMYKNYIVYVVDKFAAGSLFTGTTGNIDIINQTATINMGVPFTDRPDALEGYACYKPKAIDHTDSSHSSYKGKTDNGHVFVLLTDWSQPFAVTPPKTLIDFDGDSGIIGYGKMVFDHSMSGYEKFRIDIDYRSDRTPKYVVICGASSALGDYFTGADGSVLYLDEFKFIYE